MTAALIPRLTALDERVLAAVPEGGAVRVGHVAEQLFGERRWRCKRCGREAPCDLYGALPSAHARGRLIGCLECIKAGGWSDYSPTMRPILVASPEDTKTTREVLNGLRQVGLLRYGRGGWWRRA